MIQREFTDTANLVRLKTAHCILKEVVVDEGPDRIMRDMLTGHLGAWITVLERSVQQSVAVGVEAIAAQILATPPTT